MRSKTLGILVLLLFYAIIGAAAGAECTACQRTAGTGSHDYISAAATPINLEASISKVPVVGEEAGIRATISSAFDAPGTTYSIHLPEGAELVSGALSGTLDLAAGTPQSIEVTIKFTKPGDYIIEISARHAIDTANSWGDLKSLYLTVGTSSSLLTPAPQTALHTTTQVLPVVDGIATVPAGNTPWIEYDSGNISVEGAGTNTLSIALAAVPGKGPGPGEPASPSAAIASNHITMSGTFQYGTKDSDYRDGLTTTHGTTVLIEIYEWNSGTPLAYAWADYYTGHWQSGEFDIGNIALPYTLGVRYYTYVNWNVPGGAEARVIYDAAGGLSGLPYTYKWFSGPFSGYTPGQNVDIGTWYPYGTDPNLPALWLQEDLNRAFVTLYWSGIPNPGQGTIVWYPTSTDGAYYVLGNQIHLTGTNARSADTTVATYGYNVMYRVYGNWWPPEVNCPYPHYLTSREDCSCAWVQGWGEFLPLAVNRDWYYTLDSGVSYDLESPTWTDPNYDKGECVEGRVAGALYDIFDTHNDGADQLSFGLDEIATILKDNRMSYFRSFMPNWMNHGWPDTAATCIYQDTIDFRPSKIGVFVNGAWFRDANNNGIWDGSDFSSTFGAGGDQPVAGDWNGDGRQEIGVFRGGFWYLDMNGDGWWDAGDATSIFGVPGDIPVAGDWNANGKDKIGVFRGGFWYLDMNGDGMWGAGDTTYKFGIPGDIPVTGDWNANPGDEKDEIGVFRGGTWYLDTNGNGYWNSGDASGTFGLPGDIPITGHWNLFWDTDEIGAFRNSYFYLDADNSMSWTGSDAVRGPFGYGGWLPVAGYWN
jgi:hypothetical protein